MERNFLSGKSVDFGKVAKQLARYAADEENADKIQQESSGGIWETETKPVRGAFRPDSGTLFDDSVTSFIELGRNVSKRHMAPKPYDLKIGTDLDLKDIRKEHKIADNKRTANDKEQAIAVRVPVRDKVSNTDTEQNKQNAAAVQDNKTNKAKETDEKAKNKKTKNNIAKEKVSNNGDTTTTVRTYKDGTKEKIIQTGDKVTTISYDKAGLRTNKTITEGKGNNRQETNVEYKNGVVDKKTVTRANNKDYKAVTYYDDGKASKKVVKDGTSTINKTFKYDKDGNIASSYAEIVNDITKEKTVKSTVYDGNNKTTTEARPDGKINTYIYERQDAKSDWGIIRKEIQKQGSEDKTICEYSDKVINKDGTAVRNKKITTPSGNVYYDVQTIGTNGKVIKTMRYSDEEHKNLTTVTEANFNTDGYKINTKKVKTNKEGVTTSKVSTEYNDKTGKPKSCVKSTHDDTGKLIKNEKYTYDDNGVITSCSVMNRFDDNKISTEIQTFRSDGTLEAVENTTQGFKSFMNTKGVVSRMEFRNINPASIAEHVPEMSVSNSSLPLFSSEDGTLIGIAKYDESGRLLQIDWEAGAAV